MVIILEGVNGTGKTAYAKALEEKLGYKMYRAFRKGREKCDFKLHEVLHGMDIRANTYVDDIYMADFLQTFEVKAILERSMPSAVAYDQVYNEPWKAYSARAFGFWLEQMAKVPHIYVWLEAGYETATERRSGHHPSKKEHEGLVKVYGKLFQRMGKSKMRIDTELKTIEEGVELICQRLKS